MFSNQLQSGEGKFLDLSGLCSSAFKRLPPRNPVAALITSYCFITKLDLSSNGLAVLPEELRHCVELRKLMANNNELATLPDFLGDAPALRVIELRKNRFSSFPAPLGRVQTLFRVDLQENVLTDVPWDITRKLPRLARIDLRGN